MIKVWQKSINAYHRYHKNNITEWWTVLLYFYTLIYPASHGCKCFNKFSSVEFMDASHSTHSPHRFWHNPGSALRPNFRGVRNPMKMLDLGFLKNEPNRTELKLQKPKTQFPQFGFRKPTSAVWDSFSRCFIHNSYCSMIGSTVKVFFFMPYLCTSSSESHWPTIQHGSTSFQ